MSNKSKGIARERDVLRLLRAAGWVALRAPASIGAADIIALKRGERPRFIQVKAGQGSTYEHFGPSARRELRDAADQAGATAELCYWPPNCRPQWIDEANWP